MKTQHAALLTDLYQLTMLQAYHREGMSGTATFELFVRKIPPNRNFLIAAGLEQLVEFLEDFEFSDEECEWLGTLDYFTPEFIDHLSKLRFTGDVYAIPEGTVFFQNEPIVRVTAPIAEAQIIETRLINIVQLQTMIASKAARSALAAPGKLLVDFGLRRAHGAEAGLMAARAAYLAGFDGTSNVLAGKLFDIPVYGTMAHSYIMAHDDEVEAFERFAESLPGNVLLLIDTYDTLEAARKVVALAPRLAERNIPIKGVRLDSGDMAELAKGVRSILDEGGLTECSIFASGDLDEHELLRMLEAGAPIDGFGVGTRLTTSQDMPYLNCAYKLQEYAGRPRRKRSKGKENWPGRKQVYRRYDDEGHMLHDVMAEESESQIEGEPLLRQVMAKGKRVGAQETLAVMRERLRGQLQQLPPALKAIEDGAAYTVLISDGLQRLVERMDSAGL
ncbi:nicotinate phosphoribosyltransferase [Methylocaldum sp. RMAD-M]|jgi:nicotinate phosphoribosyltransferase|uniref:nicotinate phosphoribosyltransferase n=1 Tax=Methylocaldum sp. RMAD-M TaxID=2806557 RepID=UPI000A325B2A|nr:nicotinate phosphoribosyltransferase [Methylocaldum sp. RMAD-M]MBP1150662.1 nicotinate phosphoribosyltransferase [Methylocaldum sp. RMAD-M]